MGTPSVIACGDATFPKGTALAVAGNFAVAPKGVPLGELAANVVSRLRGYFPQRLRVFLPAKLTRNPIFQRTYVNKMEKSKNCKFF